MSWLDQAKTQLATHSHALHGIEAIAKLVRKALVDPGTDTYAVIQIVERITDTLIAGFSGKLDPVELRKQIQDFEEKLASNDEAADAALDAKFR